jgi:hypothetical protein
MTKTRALGGPLPAAMDGKALVFVTGHDRPSVAPLGAKYVRRWPDGSPQLALSTKDTPAAAGARYTAAKEAEAKAAAEAAKKTDGKKGKVDAAAAASVTPPTDNTTDSGPAGDGLASDQQGDGSPKEDGNNGG